jgi:cysteine desulfurase
LRDLRDYASERLQGLSVRQNIPAGKRAPHILNITMPNIKSETLLHALSASGVYVSQGSACSSHGHGASRALLSFGLSEAEADSSIRISFGKQNTREDVDVLISALEEAIGRLVRIKR